MKIPAIRAKIGIWVYYIAALKFSEVEQCVNDPAKIHKSKVLSELLQRSITNNVKKIADYISHQDERFFNSLVLAVYDGDPQWHEVRLDYGNHEEYYDIGLLELSGDEKIFPVDGQHRVEGIKLVLSEDGRAFSDEQIPVIFIGHRNDDEGMKKARRMFSTLNRYAKPVSKRDIIALDEDDAVAMISRDLIDNYALFGDDRILDSKTKAIPETNKTAFTTIITFYECNVELLNFFLLDKTVTDADGKKLKGSSKTNQYIRFRPDQYELDEFFALCTSFWDAVSQKIDTVQKYLLHEPKRDSDNILFRPASLIPFVKAFILIHQRTKTDFTSIAENFNRLPLKVTDGVWNGLLWDSDNKKMIMKNHKTVELRLVHLYDRRLLSEKEIQSLINSYASARMISIEDAKSKLGEE